MGAHNGTHNIETDGEQTHVGISSRRSLTNSEGQRGGEFRGTGKKGDLPVFADLEANPPDDGLGWETLLSFAPPSAVLAMPTRFSPYWEPAVLGFQQLVIERRSCPPFQSCVTRVFELDQIPANMSAQISTNASAFYDVDQCIIPFHRSKNHSIKLVGHLERCFCSHRGKLASRFVVNHVNERNHVCWTAVAADAVRMSQ